jgi:hypothetical protein
VHILPPLYLAAVVSELWSNPQRNESKLATPLNEKVKAVNAKNKSQTHHKSCHVKTLFHQDIINMPI